MENKLNLTKNKKILIVLITVVLFVALIMGIFIKFIRPKMVFEKNLKAVAKYVFVMPDKYLDDFSKTLDISSDNIKKPNLSDITTGIDKNISKYFTPNGYESFKSKWYTFNFFCLFSDYKSQVKKVEVHDYVNNQSEFIVIITYGKPNLELNELIITGTARSDSKGKIEYWNLSEESNAKMYEITKKISVPS